MVRWLVLTFVSLLVAGCATSPGPTAASPPVILVSIDGFRPDYLDRGVTPNLAGLAAGGVRGAMRPSFPTKTFPNHYTLVTGLRPDRHGIVENTFQDPAIPGETFRMANRQAVRDAKWWDQAEPIWVTAERAGIITAPVYWPGSEAAIRGVRPTHWRPFQMSRPNDGRVDDLLSLLDLPPAERPRFLTLYFDTVDTAGHRSGPDAPETTAAVAAADAQIGRLVEGLKARGVAANIVVVADHGMAALSSERRIFVDDLVPRAAWRALAAGAFMTIYPAEGRTAEVESVLLARHPNMACWRKSEMPERFHYGRNPRVAPIFCLPDTGWSLTTRDYKPSWPERGNHGFDPNSPEMAAVFVANGPGFRNGVALPTFDNVSVYPLLARLLGIQPGDSDGDIQDVAAALTN
ncbi:MAG: ectonucleotide pyrophosphatase/phosphodiesterase [Phenylobacterium sp.]|nr:ectonucleotide pyrophosphatase/phosphodiesterase [Phenylobacterium sp.]